MTLVIFDYGRIPPVCPVDLSSLELMLDALRREVISLATEFHF